MISDPSVQRMTDAQWLFEFYSLRKREERKSEETVELLKGLRQMVVDLLGLNVGRLVSEDEDFEFTVPHGILTAHPEVLNFLVEEATKKSKEKSAAEDDDFEAFSQQLMNATRPDADPGDMAPIIEDIDITDDKYVNAYMHSEEYKRIAEKWIKPRKGVTIVSDEDGE